MAIKLTTLEETSKNLANKTYIYKDLHLDFKTDVRYDTVSNTTIIKNDIGVDYDESAIRNSLRNLFSTKPGQRFLFPTYGLDLYQFLFEPITQSNANLIKDSISRSIKDFEPRVKLVKCIVDMNEDDNQYDITVAVMIIINQQSLSLQAEMNTKTKSFKFLDSIYQQRN